MSVLVAMTVFVLSHVAIARTTLKPALVARLGDRGYLIVYSIVSIALLCWVIVSTLSVDRITLWPTPEWAYAFAAFTTLLAFVLIGVGVMSPNPLSVSFRTKDFDPRRQGLIGFVRHPIIWGLSLWGVAHVPANGDWPSLILFAGSAAFGLIGAPLAERRRRRQMGDAEWTAQTAGRGAIDANALTGVALGAFLWTTFILAHPYLFGVDPFAVLLAIAG